MYPPRGYSARTGRIPGRHKNGKQAAVTCGRPAFQQHESRTEGSDTAPTQKCRKNAKREFLSPPPTGLPPKPSEAVSVGRGRATERASPAACGGTRDSSSARTTASIAFVWSAAKPLPCQTLWAGHGPTPLVSAKSAPFGTHGSPCIPQRRSLAPPLQTKPALLGFRLVLENDFDWRKT